MNMKTCKMKIYATFRTLGLISVESYFNFDLSVDVKRLYNSVCIDLILLSVNNAICSLSCTLMKDAELVSGRPGFQNTNFVILIRIFLGEN